jgi:hypothetical protein
VSIVPAVAGGWDISNDYCSVTKLVYKTNNNR